MSRELVSERYAGLSWQPREIGPTGEIGLLLSSPQAGVFAFSVDLEESPHMSWAEVWDWKTEKMLWRRRGGWPRLISPDGQWLICAVPALERKTKDFRFEERKIEVCEARTGRVRAVLDVPWRLRQNYLRKISADSQLLYIEELVSGSENESGERGMVMSAYSIETVKQMSGCEVLDNDMVEVVPDVRHILALSPDQSKVVTSNWNVPLSGEDVVSMWDVKTRQQLWTVTLPTWTLGGPQVLFSRDGTQVFLDMGDSILAPWEPLVQEVTIRDSATGYIERTIRYSVPHGSDTAALALSPDETTLAIAPLGEHVPDARIQLCRLK